MELRLQRGDSHQSNQLQITLVLRAPSVELTTDSNWHKLCTQIYCDLRAYLMAQGALAK